MNYIFLIFLLVAPPANAFLFGYTTEEECNLKELRKYSTPNDNARLTVAKYCALEFAEKKNKQYEALLKRIEKECRFKVEAARKEGYSPLEIIDYVAANDKACWQKLAR